VSVIIKSLNGTGLRAFFHLVAVMSCAIVRRHCDCFIASLAPFINIQTYLLMAAERMNITFFTLTVGVGFTIPINVKKNCRFITTCKAHK